MTIVLIAAIFHSTQSQDGDPFKASLKGISTVFVVIEALPDSTSLLGLTKQTIQTDVELKLRLAGVGVVTREEGLRLPGSPYLYVNLNLTDHLTAGSITTELKQNALLERNNEWTPGVTTWATGTIVSKPDGQYIRERIKDQVDKFLNAWLSVNPKK